MEKETNVTEQNLTVLNEATIEKPAVENKVLVENAAQIEDIKSKIDLTNSNIVNTYGYNTQTKIAQFSNSMLSELKVKDADTIGEDISDLVVKLEDFSKPSNSILDKIPFFNDVKKQIEKYKARYDTLSVQVDKVESKLQVTKNQLFKDNANFENLYKENEEYFKKLLIYIEAGKQKIKELREVDLPKLEKEVKESNDPMEIQKLQALNNTLNLFEKRLYDLEISKTISVQTVPQIKIIQNNNNLLINKIDSTINGVIPLWKTQILIALGVNRSNAALKLEGEINQTINKMMKDTSEKLKTTTIETAKAAERPMIDIETIEKVNSDIIESLVKTKEIHDAAKKERVVVRERLEKAESELKSAVMNTMDFKTDNTFVEEDKKAIEMFDM